MKQHGFTPEQVVELKDAYKTATTELAHRQLRVLLQLAEAKTIEEAADATGYTAPSVYRIRQKYLEEGIAAIVNKPQRKKHPFIAHKHKFTSEQKTEIEAARGTVANKRAAVWLEMLCTSSTLITTIKLRSVCYNRPRKVCKK